MQKNDIFALGLGLTAPWKLVEQQLDTTSYFFCRKSSGEIPACLRMARSVPSGMSPG